MRIHNVMDFPQAKLDSKINACFLLNQHRDHILLLHNFSVYVMMRIVTCIQCLATFISWESP